MCVTTMKATALSVAKNRAVLGPLQRPKLAAQVSKRNRRGAAVLEMSLVLVLFLTLTAGTLDLGIAVFRHNLLSEAARQGARRAIVHGSMAPNRWGPSTIDVPATANGIPIVDGPIDGIQPLLVAFDLDQTRIRVQWPDGSNSPESRVRVTVTTPYVPIILFFLSAHNQSASSTMPIAH